MAQRAWTWSAPTAKLPLVLDTAQALARIDGDESLLFEIHKIFQSDFPERLAALHEAVQAQDASRIQFLAHALKSMAGSVGAEVCLQETMHLEEAAKTGAVSDAAERVARLEAAFAAVRARLSGKGSEAQPSELYEDRRKAGRGLLDLRVTLRDQQGVVLPLKDASCSGLSFHAGGHQFQKGQKLTIDISQGASTVVAGLQIEIVWSANGLVGSKLSPDASGAQQRDLQELFAELGVSGC